MLKKKKKKKKGETNCDGQGSMSLLIPASWTELEGAAPPISDKVEDYLTISEKVASSMAGAGGLHRYVRKLKCITIL